MLGFLLFFFFFQKSCLRHFGQKDEDVNWSCNNKVMWSCLNELIPSMKVLCLNNIILNTVSLERMTGCFDPWSEHPKREEHQPSERFFGFQRAEQWMVGKMVCLLLLPQLFLLLSLLMVTLMWEQWWGKETFNGGRRHCNQWRAASPQCFEFQAQSEWRLNTQL